ncbi:MAG: YegS/Rv2252/BmrU family lipid kinase [Propionibacteriaceae bacterium]|nr:YegS/Rv2252/BmrU family lipid kinase [Propionibacteriaceae bacterium]
MRALALVVNPSAGHGRGRRLTAAIEQRLGDAGLRTTLTLAGSPDHARDACAEAVAAGVDGLVVVGGDGMAHIGLNACARTEVPLGVIPAGTGNDFVRGVGLAAPAPGRARDRRPGWQRATDAIVAGGVRSIDLAEVRGDLHRGTLEYVGCVVSTGYDEKVNARANNATVDLGHLSYVGAVLAEMRSFAPLRYRIEVDGTTRELDAILVAVANSGIFGGGIRIAPDYDLTDGLLNVVIVHPVALGTLVRFLPHLATGRPFDHPAIERLRVRRIVVDGDDLHGMADGEPLGDVPLTVSAAPAALRIYAPEVPRAH